MGEFIDLYRNPIFGILVLVFIILLIVVFDFFRAKQKERARKDSIDNLSKNFANSKMDENLKDFINTIKDAYPTLVSIAQSYFQTGNYETAITIYQMLNEQLKDQDKKLEILEYLGEAYYKAGFLEKSKTIFTEILRIYPHNAKVLGLYLYVCENLKQYNDALHALDCIEELSSELYSHIWNTKTINVNRLYIHALKIMHDYNTPPNMRIAKLLDIYDKDEQLNIFILRYFRIYDTKAFWDKALDLNNPFLYVDIFWYFVKEEVPFNLLEKNTKILDIYRAKGFLDTYSRIPYFELEALQLLRKYADFYIDIEFSYRCLSCNGISPFYAYRCDQCNALGLMCLRTKIVEIGHS